MSEFDVSTDFNASLSQGLCPDCQYRGFVIGPQGGLSLNIECGNRDCRARFNVSYFAGEVIWAHRLPKEVEGGAEWQ